MSFLCIRKLSYCCSHLFLIYKVFTLLKIINFLYRMVLQENICIIYQRLEAAESALILTITTFFVGPTNFESSSIHNYCYTCLYLPDKFPTLFVLLRRNFNELLKSLLHSRRQSTYKSCCSIIKSHTIYAFIYMIA